MKFQVKMLFPGLVKLILCPIFLFNLSTYADTIAVVPPNHFLKEPVASLAATNGLGASFPGDYSSSDRNPALMSALKSQYLVFGDTASLGNEFGLLDVGIFDSQSTSVATIIRFRQNFPKNGEDRDRRLNLGLSYEIPKTNLSFGLGLNYEQLSLTSFSAHSDSNWFSDVGCFYQFATSGGRPFFLGIGVNNLGDSYDPVTYDVGITTMLYDGFYSLGADGFFDNSNGFTKTSLSLAIKANQFLDLKGSYGYNVRSKNGVWAGGIFFHAPVLQLFYTFASSETNDTTTFRQTAGLALNISV